MTTVSRTSLTLDEILEIREMAQSAWQCESDYIEINRTSMDSRDLNVSLCTLLTLSQAIENAGHYWRDRNVRSITR